jgi:hypothetical protein
MRPEGVSEPCLHLRPHLLRVHIIHISQVKACTTAWWRPIFGAGVLWNETQAETWVETEKCWHGSISTSISLWFKSAIHIHIH